MQLAQQLTEHKFQDASVPVVVHLDGRINAELDRLINGGTVLACDAQSDRNIYHVLKFPWGGPDRSLAGYYRKGNTRSLRKS